MRESSYDRAYDVAARASLDSRRPWAETLICNVSRPVERSRRPDAHAPTATRGTTEGHAARARVQQSQCRRQLQLMSDPRGFLRRLSVAMLAPSWASSLGSLEIGSGIPRDWISSSLEVVKKATLGLRLACRELAAQQGSERAVGIWPIPEGGARPLLIGLAEQGVRAVERRWACLPPGPRARGAQP